MNPVLSNDYSLSTVKCGATSANGQFYLYNRLFERGIITASTVCWRGMYHTLQKVQKGFDYLRLGNCRFETKIPPTEYCGKDEYLIMLCVGRRSKQNQRPLAKQLMN